MYLNSGWPGQPGTARPSVHGEAVRGRNGTVLKCISVREPYPNFQDPDSSIQSVNSMRFVREYGPRPHHLGTPLGLAPSNDDELLTSGTILSEDRSPDGASCKRDLASEDSFKDLVRAQR